MNFRPKPRGFWDYGIFALAMTPVLFLMIWMEISKEVDWRDAVVAFTSAVLLVVAIILARRGEKAAWIAQPTWYAYLGMTIGIIGFFFGFLYADAYLLHRGDINSIRLRNDLIFRLGFSLVLVWYVRKRELTKRQS